MGFEFDALMVNRIWSLCPRPLGKHIVRNKWVFKLKRLSDGSIKRYTAWLVAKGFDQQNGIDYAKTFSPVVKHTIVWIVLALAVSFNYIHQLDISNAFLHEVLDEEVFMEQSQGFVDKNYLDYVCRLHKF